MKDLPAAQDEYESLVGSVYRLLADNPAVAERLCRLDVMLRED